MTSMSSSEDIKNFTDITGATQEQARFYIDSAKGDVNAAATTFFETGGAMSSESPLADSADSPREDDATSSVRSPIVKKNKDKAKPTRSRSGINTLGGLQKDDDSDDEDERPAEFYTGGEKSGLGVIDPSKKKDGSNRATNLIQDILKKAAAGGSADQDEPSQAPNSTFRGSGYTLGSEDEESRKVVDPNESFRRAMAAQPEKVTRILRLWQDGFSIDDGRLYRYDDPANSAWLEAINKGHAPLALLNVAYGQPVDVTVDKRTDEPYSPPPKVFKAFESSGHRLGSEMPPETSTQTTATATSSTTAASQNEPPKMDIDESKPVTSLQIRLASGARLVSQFNTTHTVQDVYAFVDRQPQAGDRPYQLLSPFPRKEFDRNNETTLEAAGLLKGVLQQKLT